MKRFVIFFAILSLSGCATISSYRDAAVLKAGYIQKSKAESDLAKTRAEYDKKLADNEKAIKLANEQMWRAFMDKFQAAGNILYGADFAYVLNPHPDRTHRIMDNKINEARALMPPPTVEAMAAQNAEVKRQLDETLTSLEDLKAAHESTLKEVAKINEVAAKAQADLDRAKQEKLDIEAAKRRELDAKQVDLDKANNSVIAAEHERGDDAKARQATKEKITMILGGFALAALAGAIWSPVFKGKFAALAAVLGFAAVALWYVTPLMVWIAFGLVVCIIIGWAVYEHSLEQKAARATYAGLEDIKKTNPALWSQIAPTMTDWQSKYVVKGGTVTTIPDTSISKHIDSTLMTINQK